MQIAPYVSIAWLLSEIDWAFPSQTLPFIYFVSLSDNGKPIETYVFLFDDMILLTKQRKAPAHKKKSIPSVVENTTPQPGTPVSRRKDGFIYMVHKPQLPLDRLDIMELDQQKATGNYTHHIQSQLVFCSHCNRRSYCIGRTHTTVSPPGSAIKSYTFNMSKEHIMFKIAGNPTVSVMIYPCY